MNERNIHIMAICEVDLVNEDLFTLSDYTVKDYNIILPRSWTCLGKSRILTYIREDVSDQVSVNTVLMTATQPDIHLRVKITEDEYINIIFYYREFHGLTEGDTMDSQSSRFMDHVELVSEAAANEETWWMGDMNIDYKLFIRHINWSKLSETLETVILEQGLFQLVETNTRGRVTSIGVEESLLDHIYTNNPDMAQKIWNITMTSSDHNIIGFGRSREIRTNKTKSRDLKNLCHGKLNEELNKHNWQKIVNKRDLDIATRNFTTTLLTTFNKLAPLKEFTHNNKNKLKLSKEIRKSIKSRDEAYKKAKLSGEEEDRKAFRKIRCRVSKEIKINKELKTREKLTNQKSAWAHYKSITNKASSGGPPEKLMVGNRVTNNYKEMAEHMNNFFINKIKVLREDIESQEVPYDATEQLKRKIDIPTKIFSLS